MTPENDKDRLNHNTERRLDSLALVVLLFNDSSIVVPATICEHLDEIGVVLLSHYRRTKGFTAEQTQEVLTAFADMMQERTNAIRGAMNDGVPRTQ